jgi:hypothetical protein
LGADCVVRRFKRTMTHIGIRLNVSSLSLFSWGNSNLEQSSLHSSKLLPLRDIAAMILGVSCEGCKEVLNLRIRAISELGYFCAHDDAESQI